ncbi:MAG: flagellar basal body rod protein FlgC [Phycisphaerae bacterium]|nr:flagellar basal body rod protein FlgC [Phycisphaerae bacterium]
MSIGSIGSTPSPVDIAVSGMRAHAMRINVIANNIANAQTTDVGDGQPYRRKDVLLSTDDDGLAGVNIDEITQDMDTQFQRVLMAGHPNADEQGYVNMPNVSLPTEMMNMVAATRAYQASTAIIKRYQEITEQTLELLR